MSKNSKFVKVDKNILIEYIYNDSNLITEPYSILVNSKYKTLSYVAGENTVTSNDISNQLFKIDTISGRYGKSNDSNYSFLQTRNYSASNPILFDSILIHLPISWTFGEYLGFYIKVYTFDSSNMIKYDISNFYFDMTNIDQQNLLNFTSPPLLFQEKLWGKNIKIDIPSVGFISNQLNGGKIKENSINYNLTEGIGLSISSPIFIDFHFINNKQSINNITSYLLTTSTSISVPQTPEFEKLGIVVKHSDNGDFFEIYGVYNDTIYGFKKFIDDSFFDGRNYYIQYNITLYEQNIRGKTTTITVTDGFNETIDYRPIIKYSTTTAIIDIEMKLIDSVDNSVIIRRASYGMLQDELSKYSLSMMKINVKNISRPKIYNVKTSIDTSLIGGLGNLNGNLVLGSTNNNTPTQLQNNVVIETIRVPYPVLIDKFNIISRSENALVDTKTFFGFGKMQILIYPFDNILKFTIASGTNDKPEYFNLTSTSEISLVIKNDQNQLVFPLFIESGEIELSLGQVAFKIGQSKINEIKKIYNSGINIFYITGKNQDNNSVIYTGLYKIYDSRGNVEELNNQAMNAGNPNIILDNSNSKETAIVTRKLINEQVPVSKNDKK